ncbi:unnamed protein product [Toxocara canis]|uniref:HEAT repeat-containing protein 1 n=1 Tax=Toxocara canis TaxID=6265 RepID=A0A183UIP9_TOXCA|nr:unnamed protein product [Toxocara canis]
MTSLQRQLEGLRTAASSQLGVERFRASLLFEKKQAAALYKEDALKIGQSGLSQLRKIDSAIGDSDTASLFDEAALSIERSLLSRAENEELDANIERLLAQISPYLQHFAAQQVLEWLIFKFQIQEFNAQRVFVTFLPFHSTNIFGRLISVLRLKGIEYDWLVDMEEMENKMPQLFSFYATVCVHLVADPAKVNDAIISKILPFLAISLKSRLVSLRLSALMTTCQLCVSVTLSGAVVNSLLKLVLLKLSESTIQQSLNTAIVICQRQSVTDLPVKGVRKLARKNSRLNISRCIMSLSKRTDLSLFMQHLWHALFRLIEENAEDEECRLQMCSFLGSLIDGDSLSAPLASTFFSNLFEFISSGGEQQLTEDIYTQIRTLVIRFGNSFDSVRAEWQVRDANVVETIIKKCNIEAHEIGDLVVETKPSAKRRRRNSSIRKSVCEEERHGNRCTGARLKHAQLVMEEQLDALRIKPKASFKGDPIEKLCSVIKSQQWDEAKLGFEVLISPKYVKQRTAEDFEEFIIEMIKIISNDVLPIKADIRNALAVLPIKSELALVLLSRCSTEPEEKRTRGKARQLANSRRIFIDEDESTYLKRLTCMQHGDEEHTAHSYLQQLIVSLLVRLLKEPRGYVVREEDLQLECVVDAIRNTREHITLRSCLSLLAAAVQISPSTVLKHMMSVFTFMGAGLLKKDNDLTLEIIEQTLSALFTAVMDEQGEALESRLISVSRLLAASILDMPAHRRLSVVCAVARAAGAKHLATIIAVLFEHYCLSWQRNDSSKGRPTVEIFEELATEMASLFDGAEQLSCVVDLLEYIVQLGGDLIESNPPVAVRSGGGSFAVRSMIFDRSKHSVQKLRHYRFTIVGWIARLLSSRDLLDKLAEMNDAEAYERLLVVGKRMLVGSVELDEMVNAETDQAEGRGSDLHETSHPNHYKYWIAFASRADILADKLRNVLPANVSARLIADILEDSQTCEKMRDRALHLLNAKLTQDASFAGESAINAEQLDSFASKLNRWIKPVDSKQEVVLCQNAAFSLKLIARRVPATDSAPALSESVALCSKLLEEWRGLDEAMVGSVLLLAGELVRHQSTRSTLQYVNKLCTVSVEVLAEQLEVPQMSSNASTTEEPSAARRKRIAQQSLSGRRIGGDVLLQCSLTALQRIVENFAQFISTHLTAILVTLSRTLARHHFSLSNLEAVSEANTTAKLSNVEHRIAQIRRALTRVEMRLLVEPFREASEQLITSPEAEVALFSMLSACLKTKTRSELLKYLVTVCDQYFTAFGLRIANHSLESYETVVECESRIIGYLMHVMDCLSENECRPIIARLNKWLEEAISSEQADSTALHLLTAFNLFNRERAQLVVGDVINELENTAVQGHEQRCIPHLADCLLQIADCHNEVINEMINKIMLKTRSTSPKVRYCTLLVLERMFDRMGDAVAPLLPSVLPFLSELLEDEKKKVEEQCDKVIALLRRKFGEEIAEGYIQY